MPVESRVIASRIEGLEMVEIVGIGLLVRLEDPADLENAQLKLLNEPERQRELSRKGSEIARRHFRREMRLDAIEQLLTGLA